VHHCAKFRGDRTNHCWDLANFRFFQDGGRPQCWICGDRVWTTYEGHLVVFITAQNLVSIDAVVLIICMFLDFICLAGKLLFTPSQLGFWGIWGISTKPPKGTSLGGKTSYDVNDADRKVRPVRVTKSLKKKDKLWAVEICPFPLAWPLH